MDSKYCSGCTQKRLLSSFLSDASNLGSKVLATCNICRASKSRYQKRKALQPLDPNIQAKRRVPRPTKAPTRPKPLIPPPAPLESRPEATIPPPNPPESRPNPPSLLESRPQSPIYVPTPAPAQPIQPPIQPLQPKLGFLPAEQWKLIQDFHTALDGVKMEYCLRCKERWFSMGLRNETCDACFLRDK